VKEYRSRRRTRRRFHGLRGLAALLVLGVQGCGAGSGGEPDTAYLAAWRSLREAKLAPSPALLGPRLLAPSFPLMPTGELERFRKAGVPFLGPEHPRGPDDTVVYFTPLDTLPDGRLSLKALVSRGARRERGAGSGTWWHMEVECGPGGCRVLSRRMGTEDDWLEVLR